MNKYILRRLFLLFPTLFGVITLVFFVMAAVPGDAARVMLGERASTEQLEKLRREYALDKPMSTRYLIYLKNVAKLDFGKSIKTGRKVTDEIKTHFPATFELTIFAMLFATIAGIIAGVISATKRYSIFDYVSMSGALVGVSMPVFWLGIVLIIIFSVKLNLFPTGGRYNIRYYFTPVTNFYIIDSIIHFFKTGDLKVFGSVISHLILPAVTLGTIPLAIITRITRSSMLEVLKEDYIKTARAIGVSERKVIFKYALKNALLPVVTVVGLQFGLLMSGALLTETIFAWPGIGKWLYHAIESRDIPAIQGGIIFISTFFVLINLSVDIIYSFVNPKIRAE